MSTNTGLAPRRTTALAVDTNVNDGMITSSPGLQVAEHRGHLQAAVQEGVISTLGMSNSVSSSRGTAW